MNIALITNPVEHCILLKTFALPYKNICFKLPHFPTKQPFPSPFQFPSQNILTSRNPTTMTTITTTTRTPNSSGGACFSARVQVTTRHLLFYFIFVCQICSFYLTNGEGFPLRLLGEVGLCHVTREKHFCFFCKYYFKFEPCLRWKFKEEKEDEEDSNNSY